MLYPQKECPVRSTGINSSLRIILYTNDVPKVLRIIDYAKKWLFKDTADDLKSRMMLMFRIEPQTLLHGNIGVGKIFTP